MSDIIPSYKFSEFMKLKAHQIKRMKSVEITSDGEYLFTVIVPQTDYIKMQTEFAAQLSNAVRGESLEDILSKE